MRQRKQWLNKYMTTDFDQTAHDEHVRRMDVQIGRMRCLNEIAARDIERIDEKRREKEKEAKNG